MNQFSDDLQELNEKIRQQYDFLPYPECDLDFTTKDKLQSLFIHSLVTPYYLRYQEVINTKDKIILDAGCGSGLQSLTLALANPGAKIVGVDISPKSVDLAAQRLAYHGFTNVEFHTLSLDDIESLGYQFDYINCDEVLYLLPNPGEMLKTFCGILAERGIIRSNLHSYYQRNAFFRSQEAFKFLGLFDESTEVAIDIVQETLDNLQDSVRVKQLFQGFEIDLQRKPKPEEIKEWILVNYLIKGDKGYTVKQLFEFLEYADLDFLSMVNWRQWDLTNIFNNLENLPFFWQFALENASEAEKLQLFELFHPIHRLLDFWAVKLDETPLPTSVMNWSRQEWLSCKVHLHPILATDKVKVDLREAIAKRENFTISRYIPLPTLKPIIIDNLLASCLLPLWESPQSLSDLVERWLLIQPRNPENLNLKTEAEAKREIQELLTQLETFTYILLELIN